jgi:hypothetical protein
MSGNSAVAMPTDAVEWRSAQEQIEFAARDEQWWQTKRRESAEAAEARILRQLNDRTKARAVYRKILLNQMPARRSKRTTAATRVAQKRSPSPEPISDVGFRIMCVYLEAADPDLSNCFVSRKKVAWTLGMDVRALDAQLAKLRAYMRAHEFRRDNGSVSSNGIQFCIPAGVLPLGTPWRGPIRFNNRTQGVRGAPRKRASTRA